MTQKGKEKIFLLMLAIFALTISANYIPNRGPEVPPAVAPASPVKPDTSPDQTPALDQLKQEPATFDHVERNLFQFGEDDAGISSETPETSEATETAETSPVEPQLPDIHYLGYYREKTGSNPEMASVSIDDHVYVGKAGDVLAQSSRILNVSQTSITVLMLADGRKFRVALGKNQPPIPIQ